MFILSELSDLIRVPPSSFNIPVHHVLKDELHKKYSNKVISNLGLAVSVWDISDIKDGLLKPGDGGAYVEVRFRIIVWKPFVGEILTGWVADCSAEGIKVRMGFFDDIFIPKDYIFESCTFSPAEKAWVWQMDEETKLYIDVNEKIRFRVEEEVFVNVKPKTSSEALGLEEQTNKAPPYALIASCQTDGMGCVSWWD
ncbi:putative DNA-directed RNA polymerase III subunit [Clavispora lusitaniae]|uniref:DNA-directed RNA polymerase subunit n=2 Tax=Clavispora lusitaniae TaxID=36911 RepID=C4Y5E5_CLAL4|nr:uncharacterized protein CLUG_03379 [Clavispora lusitaniae ATCC 42720]KAF5210160.1 DNA-directed RNA polymerase III subunit rpc25 [Clavispora lusitaniae]EEQ39251.1 hypothetical protein CLUG_03379 [Clavispora lusitaniae ATCC 42720]QFZ28147.1 putative DNA-directed RNA polymerase III subunit [Clavispora lusitaniae]QFZ33810.1 putative DNA-directed RNA polymerase III subunit [Clavispora lusitaniae]QFZ39494.1 putative DNA-directed RNA polymerase III subunit [Clavispora lusitaniae]